LWDETKKAKGKLKVSGGHRVGWLHDMIQTTPFCDFRVTSERRSDSILSIKEGAHGIVINTSFDSSGEKTDGSYSRSLFVSIRHPRSLACRAGRKQLPVAVKILGIVERGSHCSSCIVGHGPHYVMVSAADTSAATPTPGQYAERLLPYLRTYPAQGSNHAAFIKAWIVILSGMARRPGPRFMPPCLTMNAMLLIDNTVIANAYITSDWWVYWNPVLPALIKYLIPVAMDGTGVWLHPMTDGQFNVVCRRSMEESYAQDPNITPTAYAKLIAKTCKAFNHAWTQGMSSVAEYNLHGRTMKGPEVEQLLTTHFMEEGLFQLINDRIGSWAGRLQKA
jgi:hypothetical protein